MSKSMSELMSSPHVGLPEAVVVVSVAGRLATELQAADDALFAIEAEIEELREASGGGEPAKRRRLAERSELVELREKAAGQAKVCDEIRDRMAEHSVAVKVRAKNSGQWRAFADEHPPRSKDEDRAGFTRDARLASLSCNVDDLASEAHQWIVAYGDDSPTAEMWDFLAANAVPSEMDRLASQIAALHVGGVDAGKSRSDWLASRRAETN